MDNLSEEEKEQHDPRCLRRSGSEDLRQFCDCSTLKMLDVYEQSVREKADI